MPDVEEPEDLPDDDRWHRMHGIEIRLPAQPQPDQPLPSRLWVRSRYQLDGDTTQVCALAYVSDMFTGFAAVPGIAIHGPITSIDHSVWFHRKAALDEWVLMDLQPESASGGRATYTGPDLQPGRRAGRGHRAGDAVPARDGAHRRISAVTGDTALVAVTASGPVRGAAREDLRVWRGIPYARPPSGELRFRPPQPPEAWRDVRAAAEPGRAAWQADPADPFTGRPRPLERDEDCLVVNVTVPAAPPPTGRLSGARLGARRRLRAGHRRRPAGR